MTVKQERQVQQQRQTTILKKMSEEDVTNIMPTQGFNIKALVSHYPYQAETTLI